MTKADARKVALYHATNKGCTVFGESTRSQFGDKVWQGHFISDLIAIRETPVKPRTDAEVARIMEFLTA